MQILGLCLAIVLCVSIAIFGMVAELFPEILPHKAGDIFGMLGLLLCIGVSVSAIIYAIKNKRK